MSVRPLIWICAVFAAVTLSAWSARAEVTAEKSNDKVTIRIDGEMFTEYLIQSGSKPILWPIIGPTGAEMTRAYPMKKVSGEETDHVHQRSFWFTHGDVNGIDFWMEGPRAGKQVHKEFLRVESGSRATVVTRNDWVTPDGAKLLEDERQLSFFSEDGNRVIDFAIRLTPTDGPVTFGDTKEGSFGLRVAESMRVALPKSAKASAKGRIVNNSGQTDDRAWGKRASWVDYSGPVKDSAGKEAIAGITIFNHPSSFRYPTYWHVRTYGLFAANPFGVHDFEGRSAEKEAGKHTLAPGDHLMFKYRVVFHTGSGDEGQIKRAFERYEQNEKESAK